MPALDIAEDESQREDPTEYEASHDFNPDEEELRQEVVGGKRLAEQPSEELERQTKE